MLVRVNPNAKAEIIIPPMPWSFGSTVSIFTYSPADTPNWGA
jgi:hypothetical protein